MKLRVKIDDQMFDVEVNDLSSRPILASVDGETFEIWPEDAAAPEIAPLQAAPAQARPVAAAAEAAVDKTKSVTAPIPGVIISIAVKEGDVVKQGQELCVLEAMKMKNAIRATRAGRIAEVFVSAGETVNHSAPMVSFAE